ncbi:Peptidyl-prolyl cis-trans isomerase cyp18 [compost metagenome]
MTKIIPIFSPERAKHFVNIPRLLNAGIGDYHGTAPLKKGQHVSLLGVSVVKALLDSGEQDPTDSISCADVAVDTLVFRLKNGQFLSIPTNKIDANFLFRPSDEGATGLVLVERIYPITLLCTNSTDDVDIYGEPLTNTSGVPNSVYLRLAGTLQPGASDLYVDGDIVPSGEEWPVGEEPIVFEGYTVSAQRENLNRRVRPADEELDAIVESDAAPSELKFQDAVKAHPSIEIPDYMRNPRVRLEMGTFGVIVLELDPKAAPKSVANFLQYVEAGHYDGLLFHRVIPGFMIQGGGFDRDWKQPVTRETIENEANNRVKNEKYTVAMARTSMPHSASAQFFINVADNSFLDHTAPTAQGWGYAVFGKVVEGTDVVDRIAAVATGRKGFHDDVPKELVVIDQAVVVKSQY